jgi:CubicO group peptidase (beta-lactamase class C family)
VRSARAARALAALAILIVLLAACSGGDAREAPRADAPVGAVAATAPFCPSVGLDSARLAEVYQRAAALPRLHSLLVARHGTLEAEEYFRGPGRDGRANIKSASKSVLSALVGIAIAEGHLTGVDQRIAPFFERDLRENPDPRKPQITIGHLLSMQSGLEPTSFGNYGQWVSSSNWVRYAITRPMVDEPGGRMLYSTGSTHLLSAILTRAAGMSTFAYARERLAEPLGIELRPWTTDPQGIFFGGNEMRLTPREMLRFGELYRNGGVYQGRQIVPAEWLRESWEARTVSPLNGHRYGYGWWIKQAHGHPVYFAWGYGGQYIFVVPDLELVAVTTSDPAAATRDGGHLRAVHSLLDNGIVPAAQVGRGTACAGSQG